MVIVALRLRWLGWVGLLLLVRKVCVLDTRLVGLLSLMTLTWGVWCATLAAVCEYVD